ncbi:hypothetical protein [Wenjunlia tyrosinilytica]|nr:hypothetical protein [Wenjunlia tyrosinilytica]
MIAKMRNAGESRTARQPLVRRGVGRRPASRPAALVVGDATDPATQVGPYTGDLGRGLRVSERVEAR